MSAQKLRDAAARIRETAQATEAGDYWFEGLRPGGVDPDLTLALRGAYTTQALPSAKGTARHIQLWSPPVALAVSLWLDAEADFIEAGEPTTGHPQAVADLILGGAR